MRAILTMTIMWAANPAGLTGAESAPGPAAELRSANPAVRRHAIRRLQRAGERSALPLLTAALEDDAATVRAEAARSLGALRAAGAVGPLVDRLQDSDPNVRFYAAEALGKIGKREAVDGLLAALSDPEWPVRDQAAWALQAVGDPRTVPRLVALLAEPRVDAAHVIWLLRQFPEQPVVEALRGALRSSSAGVRQRAIAALQRVGDTGSVPAIVARLGDEDPRVRRAAVIALQQFRDPRSVAAVKRMLESETEPDVQQAARRALVHLSRRADLAACWSFDRHEPPLVRDETGRGNDGQLHGARPVPGKQGRALQFDGQAYIEFGRPPDLDMTNRPLTIMAWVKPQSPRGVIIARGGKFCGFSLYVLEGTPRFGIHRFEDGPMYVAAGAQPLRLDGNWVHLAGVILSDRIELYVNGHRAAVTKTKGPLPGNCGQGMEVGFDAGNSPAEIVDHFRGAIDEVRIFQAGLTGSEIEQQMQLTVSGTGS